MKGVKRFDFSVKLAIILPLKFMGNSKKLVKTWKTWKLEQIFVEAQKSFCTRKLYVYWESLFERKKFATFHDIFDIHLMVLFGIFFDIIANTLWWNSEIWINELFSMGFMSIMSFMSLMSWGNLLIEKTWRDGNFWGNFGEK